MQRGKSQKHSLNAKSMRDPPRRLCSAAVWLGKRSIWPGKGLGFDSFRRRHAQIEHRRYTAEIRVCTSRVHAPRPYEQLHMSHI
eukprot:4601984-Pleurochrysis_carterae.AAC.1